LTADHFIGNIKRFKQLLRAAYQGAESNALVTLGIEPSYPATGYGYIQVGEMTGRYENMAVHRALRFKEKPDENTAKLMYEDGGHAWNSGMFVWRVERVWQEIGRQMPVLFTAVEKIEAAWGKTEQDLVVQEIWAGLSPQTIDYGIMEGAENVVVIPASGLDWNDVGSWESFFDVLDGDDSGNIVRNSSHVGIDTKDSLVFGNRDGRLIVTIGVQDLIVVDTGDVLMVCPKDQAQKVRQAVDVLRKSGSKLV
jgi:mannose-1-phosphate guanylyltransferase